MVNKIVERLNSINKFSSNIIRVGCFVSFLLCVSGLVLINYNTTSLHTVSIYVIGSSMVYTSIILFSQTVIGGLIIDFLGNVIGSGN